MSVLLLSVFLLVIGIAYLTTIERDAYFQTHAELQSRARFVARSGIEYYYDQVQYGADLNVPPGPTMLSAIPIGTTTVVPYQLDAAGTEFFTIMQLGNISSPPVTDPQGTGCQVVGYIQNSQGHIIAQRTLVMTSIYDLGTVYEPFSNQ